MRLVGLEPEGEVSSQSHSGLGLQLGLVFKSYSGDGLPPDHQQALPTPSSEVGFPPDSGLLESEQVSPES